MWEATELAKALKDTAARALVVQIDEKIYATILTAGGISHSRIISCGIAFYDKKVLVGRACSLLKGIE